MEDRGLPATYHVLPAARGGWMVKRDGDATALAHFAAKEEAVICARVLAAGDGDRHTGRSATCRPSVVVHDSVRFAWMTSDDGTVARVENPSGSKRRPTFGSARGRFAIADDFDEMPPDFDDYL